jgi:hypothetical protein
MLRADHWETTAVAELRTHAEALAAHLLDAYESASRLHSAPIPVISRLQRGHMPERAVHAANRHF